MTAEQSHWKIYFAYNNNMLNCVQEQIKIYAEIKATGKDDGGALKNFCQEKVWKKIPIFKTKCISNITTQDN